MDIDEVPVVAFTLYSNRLSDYELRRGGSEIDRKASRGAWKQRCSHCRGTENARLLLKSILLRFRPLALIFLIVAQALQAANQELPAGDVEKHGKKYFVQQAGQFFHDARELESLIIGVNQGSPVYLRDIADIKDGPGERISETRITFGPAAASHNAHFAGEGQKPGNSYNMVTIALAKKKGQNAVTISKQFVDRMKKCAASELSPGVHWVMTRNDGERANDAVNELIGHLTWAIVIILVLSVVKPWMA